MPAKPRLTDADLVWNRACGGTEQNLRDGDRALAALLLVHGYIMNGGVGHAVTDLPADELDAGIRGYEFFGLYDLVSIIKQYPPNEGDEDACRHCDRYYSELGDDRVITEHFERLYSSHPELFAPL